MRPDPVTAGDQVLPVRIRPAPGESAHSYATRLAAMNGRPVDHLIFGALDRRWRPMDIKRLSLLSGIDVDALSELVVERYPPSVAGYGRLHTRGWRLPRPGWTCPVCVPATGIYQRDWALGLHPVCQQCQVYLTTATPHSNTSITTAPRSVLAAVTRAMLLAEATRTSTAARHRVRALYRLCAQVGQIIDDTWPPRPDTGAPLDLAAARHWGRYPCREAATTAAILLAVLPAIDDPTRATELRADAERRLRDAARPIPRPARQTRRRPVTVRGPAGRLGFTPAERDRLHWLTTQLRHHAHQGLQARHVPAYTPDAAGTGLLPDARTWPQRADTAVVLHVLLARVAGAPSTATTTCHAFGASNDQPFSRIRNGVELGYGITAPNAERVLAAADHLTRSGVELNGRGGLIDYQERRDLLRDQPALTTADLRRFGLAHLNGAELVARAWTWVLLTHGPTYTAGAEIARISNDTVLHFHRSLDPTGRLALHDHGQRYLADRALSDGTAAPRPTIKRTLRVPTAGTGR